MIKLLIKIHCWLFPYKLDEMHEYNVRTRKRSKILQLMQDSKSIFVESINHPTFAREDYYHPYQTYYRLVCAIEAVCTGNTFKSKAPKDITRVKEVIKPLATTYEQMQDEKINPHKYRDTSF